MHKDAPSTIEWEQDGSAHSARWRSEGGWAAPSEVRLIDERIPSERAFELASAGVGLLWTGDYHAAGRLLAALGKRLDRSRARTPRDITAAFHQHRADALERARILGLLLIPLDAAYVIPLDRAPDVRAACTEAYGDPDAIAGPAAPAASAAASSVPAATSAAAAGSAAATTAPTGNSVLALRELLGVIGAHEWRGRGVPIRALGGDRIHPHYGVFSPVRGEYLDLVAAAPLPAGAESGRAFDIGTGTGVLAAILARRGIRSIVATDQDPRALACAAENLGRLGHAGAVELVELDLFPTGTAALIVCNPPWLPAPARAGIDHAVYDPDSQMLRGFLAGLPAHLTPHGEGWLIISDLAERLGLRSRGELLDLIEDAGLEVVGRLDTRPTHDRAADQNDPLHAARAAEITSLWRLRLA